jgi:hypothetical protein
MKYLCAGLSRTGTLSLCKAFELLELKSIHWEPKRMRDIITGKNQTPNFKIYDDVDVVTDLPASYFYKEIAQAYPECKMILTVRNSESWFSSMKRHYEQNIPVNLKDNPEMLEEAKITQKYVYGSESLSKFLYIKKFEDHNRHVVLDFPNCLVMNITAGDGWKKLCEFIGKPIPQIPFPKENVTKKILL